MVKYMDKRKIIALKEEGLSNREVARQTGYDRDTVSKYWNEYRQQVQRLNEPGADVREFLAKRKLGATVMKVCGT